MQYNTFINLFKPDQCRIKLRPRTPLLITPTEGYTFFLLYKIACYDRDFCAYSIHRLRTNTFCNFYPTNLPFHRKNTKFFTTSRKFGLIQKKFNIKNKIITKKGQVAPLNQIHIYPVN